ncbi:MAG: hypothetical protein PUC91_09915 [Olsenella sp.]|nr:hypothetical protein [Olsenella sp.]
MTTGVAPNIDFITEIAHNFRLEIEKFNYQDAALVLEGFEDALRGPALFLSQDFSEISYLAACKSREKLVPFAQLRGTVLEELGIDIEDYDESSLNVCPPATSRIQRVAWQNGMERVYHSSYNGAINVHLKPLDKPYAIIGADGWDDYPRCTYGVDVIVALDLRRQSGIMRKRDNERAKALIHRFERDVSQYRNQHDKLAQAYRNNAPALT